MMHLTKTRYSETNHTHLSELLRKREGIVIGRTTLRRILVGADLVIAPDESRHGRVLEPAPSGRCPRDCPSRTGCAASCG